MLGYEGVIEKASWWDWARGGGLGHEGDCKSLLLESPFPVVFTVVFARCTAGRSVSEVKRRSEAWAHIKCEI